MSLVISTLLHVAGSRHWVLYPFPDIGVSRPDLVPNMYFAMLYTSDVCLYKTHHIVVVWNFDSACRRLRRCSSDIPKSGKDMACVFLPVASLSLEVKWKWLSPHYYILQVACCYLLAIICPFRLAEYSFPSCQNTTCFVHVKIAFSFHLLSWAVNLHPLPMIVEKWIPVWANRPEVIRFPSSLTNLNMELLCEVKHRAPKISSYKLTMESVPLEFLKNWTESQ